MACGAALVLASAAIASMWLKEEPEVLYLRIAEDNFDYMLAPNHRDEDGPISLQLVQRCGIKAFTLDSAIPDRTGSAFVEVETTPRANLNCVIGEARLQGLSLAIVDDAANGGAADGILGVLTADAAARAAPRRATPRTRR